MNQLPDNVRQTINKLLPQSVVNDIACFTFYDKHPKDQRPTDITVCTQKGEVKEYYRRELVHSILIENLKNVTEIVTLRNDKCELYYIVVAKNEIAILSKKKALSLQHRIFNVNKYILEEPSCKGLKIFCNDDAVPIAFDDDMNRLADSDIMASRAQSKDSTPIINQLMRKLIEAKYTTKCNDNTLNDFIKFRQMTAFQMYRNSQADSHNCTFRIDQEELSNSLQVEIQDPFIRICNKKIVILTNLINRNVDPIKDVYVLLHGSTRPIIEYASKVYVQTPNSPFWRETFVKVGSNEKCTLVTIVRLDEVKHSAYNRVEFEIVVSMKIKNKDLLLPLDNYSISTFDINSENYDLLVDYQNDINNLMLSVVATSQRVDLCFRHVKNSEDDDQLTPANIFCDGIKMDSLAMYNGAIFKSSRDHDLYGMLVFFDNDFDGLEDENIDNIQVYARSSAQMLSLIHYIYDAVPYTIIITTPEYEITAKIKELAKYDEKKTFKLNYANCAMSVQNQVDIMEGHLKKCILNSNVDISDFGVKEIDLLAEGNSNYFKYKDTLVEESLNGINNLSFEQCDDDDSEPDIMVIDE